jgi:dihydrofolate synthase / folylpolyglutamate synthase
MSYSAALSSLHARVGELHAAPGAPRRKFRIEEMQTLVAALDHPERRFRSILIAGTNGKGSTAATLASILQAAGLRTGLYTSPHLIRVNERIRIDGQPISDDDFARHYFRVDDCANQLIADGKLPASPSFFEALTALAFEALAEARVDIAVLEVGMGGRLDATNVVHPLLSVITDISLDHTEWLGDTITLIAREKAGILRPNGVLITLPQHPEANRAIGEAAVALDVRGVNAADYIPFGRTELKAQTSEPPGAEGVLKGHGSSRAVPAGQGALRNQYPVAVLGQTIQVDSPLFGDHQRRNIALAIAAAVEIRNLHGYTITPAHIEAGIRTTQWPGRLEMFTLPARQPFSHATPGSLNAERCTPGALTQPSPSALSGSAAAANSLYPAPCTLHPVLLDVAHNPAGVWTLRAALSALRQFSFPGGSDSGLSGSQASSALYPVPCALHPVLVFGCMRDKAFVEMAQILFPLFSLIVTTPVASPRSATAEELAACAAQLGVRAVAASDPLAAFDRALAEAPPGSLIVVAGSVYLIGEIRQLLLVRGAASGPQA